LLKRSRAYFRKLSHAPAVDIGVELRNSLNIVIELARAVTETDSAWETPLRDSQAGSELLAEEARQAGTTGSWPWLMAPTVARWALWAAVEETIALRDLIDVTTTSYGADVLCRSVLESSSLAWWLLDPDIDAEGRLARILLYRYSTARQTQKAAIHLGIGQDVAFSGYGEMPETVEEEARAFGFEIDRKRLMCREATLPGYSERVAAMMEAIWPQPKLPYAQLSAVAHAELLGLTRNLTHLPRPPRGAQDPPVTVLRPTPDQEGFWFWQDTYLAGGALLFAGERAASFLGLEHQARLIGAATETVQKDLTAVRPRSPDPADT
jgi:hypothetical protein